MKLMVTGSRDWTQSVLVDMVLNGIVERAGGDVVIIHGDCPTGADAMAQDYIDRNMMTCITYPADWEKHGKAAGPIRNKQMVDSKPDLVVGFINMNSPSKGTRGALKMAQEAGIPCIIYTREEVFDGSRNKITKEFSE